MTKLKFDLMIVATAVVTQEQFNDLVFVTTDEHQLRRAKDCGLDAKSPAELQPKQLRLVEDDPGKAKGS